MSTRSTESIISHEVVGMVVLDVVNLTSKLSANSRPPSTISVVKWATSNVRVNMEKKVYYTSTHGIRRYR